MHPVLFENGAFVLYSHRACLLIGLAVATAGILWESRRRHGTVSVPWELPAYSYLGALLGAKLAFILQNGSWTQLWRAFFFCEGGLVSYGALAGGVLVAAAYMLIRRLPLLPSADLVVPYLALGQAITRIGCFLNGCCYGRSTSVPWGVSFPPGSPAFARQVQGQLVPDSASAALPVHPTQLYMVAGLILTFILLKLVLAWRPFDSAVVLGYMLCYGLLRLGVDAFRADSSRVLCGCTVAQLVGIVFVLIGAAGLGLAFVRRRAVESLPTSPGS
jgi:phosphatidylglycerol:prolipoprotein diacylglycerol transferase